ncbi:uncharacterized protein LOC112081607 [Eutrema salsugineum]|uniref:uncharacterized protein LOC112081607 n=1 Tax=Eutrema salsugineum TaxID=72664 RepID=UPI000CECF8C0|nr:uncharacterized protein LOC112081607 [Eutrema salsugineum]
MNDYGFRILLAYHQRDPAWHSESFLSNVRKEWLWKSLLSDDDMDSRSADNEDKTTSIVLQDKYSETGESPWYCDVCSLACKSFEDFTTHLKSGTHGFSEWDRWASKNLVDRRFPSNFEWGRSKEWDRLNCLDLMDCVRHIPYEPLDYPEVEIPAKIALLTLDLLTLVDALKTFKDLCKCATLKEWDGICLETFEVESPSKEWDLWANKNNVDRCNPANFEWGRSKEWDRLNCQDLLERIRLRYYPLDTTEVESPSKEQECNSRKTEVEEGLRMLI